MSKGIYCGVSNLTRKVKKLYVGVNNTARKVKKIYVGVNGAARLAYTSSVPAGEVIFTSSQVWTVPDGVSKVDVFLVGGGASGAKGNGVYSGTGSWYRYAYSGVGGCSGKTLTLKNISVTPNSQISVVVGSGGAARTTSGETTVNNGGNSSFGSYSVEGGTAKTGGSGGGGSSQHRDGSITFDIYFRTDGASDGGTSVPLSSSLASQIVSVGQGTTTRAWGESTGTLYAGGGGGGAAFAMNNNPSTGGWSSYYWKGASGGAGGGGNGGDYNNYAQTATAGTPNTGSGGGGGGARAYSSYGYAYDSGAGGSGLVIVRWAAQ